MYIPTDQELEKNKVKYIIANLREGIILVDFDKNIVEFNKAAEDLTGFAKIQAVNQPVGSILKFFDADKEIYQETYAPISSVEMDGVVYSKDQINMVDAEQKLKLVKLTSYRVKGGSKINLGAIIKIENVMEQSEFEKMKLDFVSMSVHTLRTPLTILRGFLSQLNRPETIAKLSPLEVETLNDAIEGGTQLRDLIEKLLSFAELQQTTILKMAPLSLDSLIQYAVKEYKDKADQKGLFIRYIPPVTHIPLVNADLLKMEEVIKRLLDNAISFTDEGGVEIRLYENKDTVEVAIGDTGRGIPTKNLPHVFEKFYRVKSEALDMSYGTGISLSICKRIIDQHKGLIRVESQEGKGTIFYFNLPAIPQVRKLY